MGGLPGERRGMEGENIVRNLRKILATRQRKKPEKWKEINRRYKISHCFIWHDFKQLERPLISLWLSWYHVVLSGVGELSPNSIC